MGYKIDSKFYACSKISNVPIKVKTKLSEMFYILLSII